MAGNLGVTDFQFLCSFCSSLNPPPCPLSELSCRHQALELLKSFHGGRWRRQAGALCLDITEAWPLDSGGGLLAGKMAGPCHLLIWASLLPPKCQVSLGRQVSATEVTGPDFATHGLTSLSSFGQTLPSLVLWPFKIWEEQG